MHRIRPRRSRKTSQLSWSSTDSMVAMPSSPTTSSTMSLRGSARNTGFPDSFDGHRNTCLPHPDAIISPNATITEADIALGRASARHRMSLQANQARAAAADPHQHPAITDSTYCASPTAISTSHDSAVSRLALSSLRGLDLSRSRESTSAHDHDRVKSDADSLHSAGSASPTHPPARAEESGGGRGKKRRRSLLARLTHR